jgi:hypothetical protein
MIFTSNYASLLIISFQNLELLTFNSDLIHYFYVLIKFSCYYPLLFSVELVNPDRVVVVAAIFIFFPFFHIVIIVLA